MAAGKPIVSTRVRDVVRDHGDLVFLADDATDFVQLARVAAARFAADPSSPTASGLGPATTAGTPPPPRCSLDQARLPVERSGVVDSAAARRQGALGSLAGRQEPRDRRWPRRPERGAPPRRPRLPPRREERPDRRPLPVDRRRRVHLRLRRAHLLHHRQICRWPVPLGPRGQLPRAAPRKLGLPLRRLSALPVPGEPVRLAARGRQGMPPRRGRGEQGSSTPPRPPTSSNGRTGPSAPGSPTTS